MMKSRSLAFKLITGGISCVLIPLVVVGLFSITKASKALETVSREQAVNIAKDLANLTQIALLQEVKIARELASGNATIRAAAKVAGEGVENAAADLEKLAAKFERAAKVLGNDYESLLVTDATGIVISDGNGGKHRGISLAQREYFKEAKSSRKAMVGTVVQSKISGKPVIPICAPVLSADKGFVGSVVSVLKIDFISDKITSVKVGETGYAFMVDKTGLIIAHPNQRLILKTSIARLKGMESIQSNMRAQKTAVETYFYEGMDKIAGYAPVALKQWSIAVTQPSSEFLAAAHAIRNMILIVGSIFLTLTIIGFLYFTRGITRPINLVIHGLSQGAHQVSAAAGQVSSSSQSLAESASEQAASVEETSATLEEISSKSQETAELTLGAEQLMNENIEKSGQSLKALVDVTRKMARVEADSDKIGQIIKTIDQIAFQTNLLALNAAVEAARAGEAGSGFAVVADEVRNLALRSTEAAKSTQELLNVTISRISDASNSVKDVNNLFEDIIESATVMGEKTASITNASKEQANGIEQISTATQDIDAVTQRMASTAEESASASEELSAQAEEMQNFVKSLVEIVEGSTQASTGTPRQKQTATARFSSRGNSPDPLKIPGRATASRRTNRKIANEQIMFENDDDFKDF